MLPAETRCVLAEPSASPDLLYSLPAACIATVRARAHRSGDIGAELMISPRDAPMPRRLAGLPAQFLIGSPSLPTLLEARRVGGAFFAACIVQKLRDRRRASMSRRIQLLASFVFQSTSSEALARISAASNATLGARLLLAANETCARIVGARQPGLAQSANDLRCAIERIRPSPHTLVEGSAFSAFRADAERGVWTDGLLWCPRSSASR